MQEKSWNDATQKGNHPQRDQNYANVRLLNSNAGSKRQQSNMLVLNIF